ncbi:MAG: serine/threonine protein kinase, partial [Acidobacteria bacterium]|nr:serine/threonine protein kinase [Acidobacteriota bacterium]
MGRPLTPGAKLGPYELIAPLGEGGMGEVWKARDPRLDRLVAIKTSKRQFSERFDREARAVAALNHPNICQIYDVGPDYLVMELIDGEPIKGPLSEDRAIEYAAQILDALD